MALEVNGASLTPDLFTFDHEVAGVKTIPFGQFVTACQQFDHLDRALTVITAVTTLNDILGTDNPGVVQEKLRLALRGEMPNLQITKDNLAAAIDILDYMSGQAPINPRADKELQQLRQQAAPLYPKPPRA